MPCQQMLKSIKFIGASQKVSEKMHCLHGESIEVLGWVTEGADENEERLFILEQSLPKDCRENLDFLYGGEIAFVATQEEIELEFPSAAAAVYARYGIEMFKSFPVIVNDRKGLNETIQRRNDAARTPLFLDED